jgi:flagellar hook-basal body complex protein FliE
MSTPIGGIGGIGGVGGVGGLDRGGFRLEGLDGGLTFADTLKRALGDVVELQDGAADAIGAFVRGEPVELHQVMAAVEEAGIALELLIEIRNKLTDAYRTVINMQS